jgi:hypothetical protein
MPHGRGFRPQGEWPLSASEGLGERTGALTISETTFGSSKTVRLAARVS